MDEEQYYSSEGEYRRMAVLEYAREHGRLDSSRAWICSPFDTWEPNPFYEGPPVRHPEDDPDDDEGDNNIAHQDAMEARGGPLISNWLIDDPLISNWLDDDMPF